MNWLWLLLLLCCCNKNSSDDCDDRSCCPRERSNRNRNMSRRMDDCDRRERDRDDFCRVPGMESGPIMPPPGDFGGMRRGDSCGCDKD